MANVFKTGVIDEQLLYVDPVTGELSESASDVSLVAASFKTANWELDDSLLGSLSKDFRGAVDSVANQPSGSEVNGTRYIVGSAPAGGFATFSAKQIVQKFNGVWQVEPAPKKGTLVFRKDMDALLRFDNDTFASGAWVLAIEGLAAKDLTSFHKLIKTNVSGFLDQSFLQYNVNFGGNVLSGVSAPVAGTDASNKTYADARETAAKAYSDATFVHLSGDTLTGNLVMGANFVKSTAAPVAADDLTRKGYVDAQDALKVAKAGDTMTGDLTMGANFVKSTATPVAADDMTRKGYVDAQDALKVTKAGDTMSGNLDMGANFVRSTAMPLLAGDMSRKGYVDQQDALKVSKTGDTMSGDLTMGANFVKSTAAPVVADDLTRKGYVDAQDALKVSKTGDTMSGVLDMTNHVISGIATPVAGTDAANKQFVIDQMLAAGAASEWQKSVFSTVLAPPSSPVLGDRYLVGKLSTDTATGAFAGKQTQIAEWNGTSWTFTAPSMGTYVSIDDEQTKLYLFAASNWSSKAFEATTADEVFLHKNGVAIELKYLASGKIYLGNASGNVAAVAPTGDVTIDNAGVTLIGAAKVDAGKLASDAVTTVKILDANVTLAKLAANSVDGSKIIDGSVSASELASDSVTTIKILDANVTGAKLADGSITTAKIVDANVTLAKLATGSVDASKIVDGSVGTAKIADGAVTTIKLLDANVTTAKIADGAILSAKIGDHEVHGVKLNSDVAGISLSYNGTSNAIDVAFAAPANYGSTDSGKAVKAGDIAGTGAGQGSKAIGFDGTGQHYIVGSATSDAALKALDNEMYRYEGAVAATTGGALVGYSATGQTYATGTTVQAAIAGLDAKEVNLEGRLATMESSQPGAVYDATGTVLKGNVVAFSSNGTVSRINAASASYAIGIAAYAKDGAGKVRVLADDNQIVGLDLSGITGLAAGMRLFLSEAADGALTKTMPTTAGTRVWQVGIVSDASAPASAKVHVEVKFIKVNA